MVTRLNCWLAAMLLWIQHRGRNWTGVRRSHSFRGLIPHFGYAERTGFRRCRSIEYRPPKGRLWSKDDIGVVFAGEYVVLHYQLVQVDRCETRDQALASHYFPKKNKKVVT